MRDERIFNGFSAIGDALALADGENLSILGIFNAVTSPFDLLVDRILLMSASLTAVTGVGVNVNIRRLSALAEGDGDPGALKLMDPARAENGQGERVDGYVTVFRGGTGTARDTLRYGAVNNDEISLTGQADVVERVFWRPPHPDAPLVLPPGWGADIFMVTSSTAGALNAAIEGRVRSKKGLS